jgi:hypothetical protein
MKEDSLKQNLIIILIIYFRTGYYNPIISNW